MKKGYWVIAALVLLAVVVSIVFISMMPDQVPMHYNGAGQVDRMGSKYENLILPGVLVFMGVTFIVAGKSKPQKKSEEIVVLATGISLMVAMNILNVVILYMALTYEPGPMHALDVAKLVMVILGVVLVSLGNFMPKFRRNAFAGVRTRWSTSSDVVWQKSQRLGGIASVICGILMLLGALFFANETAMVVLVVLFAVWIVVCVGASYLYYKQERQDSK